MANQDVLFSYAKNGFQVYLPDFMEGEPGEANDLKHR